MSIKQLVVRCLAVCLLASTPATAGEKLHIAVAANFLSTFKVLADEFEQQSGIETIISMGSTGKLFSQIIHGAPYHIYLAADRKRPELLVQQDLASEKSLIHYATGVLLLWAPKQQLSDHPLDDLETDRFRKIAIADIRNAPYGQASYSLLDQQSKLKKLQAKLVYGDSVAQAFHMVATGQVQAGFVAKSQLLAWDRSILLTGPETRHVWEVPLQLYDPVEQYMVSLGRSHPGTQVFIEFIQSSQARDIIHSSGYQTGSRQ